MTIKQNSWEAFQEITRGGVAKTQAERVFQTLQFMPGATRAQLAEAMSLSINSICGRVKELLDAEVIYVAKNEPCPITGRKAEHLKVVTYAE